MLQRKYVRTYKRRSPGTCVDPRDRLASIETCVDPRDLCRSPRLAIPETCVDLRELETCIDPRDLHRSPARRDLRRSPRLVRTEITTSTHPQQPD